MHSQPGHNGITVAEIVSEKKAKLRAELARMALKPEPLAAQLAPQSSIFPSVYLSSHRPRFKLPSPFHLSLGIILVGLIVTAALMHHAITTSVSDLYTKTFDKIALYLHPLPPAHAGQLRLTTIQVPLAMSKIEHQTISINFAGSIEKPSPQTIGSWINKSKNYYGEVTLTPNQTAITNYLNQQVIKLTTAPVDQVTVTHPDGTVFTIQNGINGLGFPSVSSLSQQINSQLLGGKGINSSLNGLPRAFGITDQPTQSTLLEADITTNRLYAYQSGSLIRTFLTTAGAPATPTPIGTFHIWDKTPLQNMTGYNPNGTKYLQPNVPWINYFDYRGDAIHGNYWRPASYFGNVSSSHGCIGVSVSDAQWIYNWAPIGTEVITHF